MFYFFYRVQRYVGLMLILLVGVTLVLYSSWIDDKLFGTAPPVRNAPAAAAPVGGSTPAGAPSPAVRAAVIRQIAEAQTLLADVSDSVTQALQAAQAWKTQVEPLRNRELAEPVESTGEGGDPAELFDRLAYVLRRERLGTAELRDVAARVDAWRIQLEDGSRQSPPVPPTLDAMVEIRQLHANCQQAEADWERDLEQALAIHHLLAKQSAKQADVRQAQPAAPTTIGDQVEEADARAALDQLDRQIVHEQKLEAAERAREAKLAEERRIQAQREAELLAEVKSPEVQALLAPFLQDRDVQPRMSGASIRFQKTFDSQPMSLAALHGIGALDESLQGLKRLALLGGHRKLSPPKWSVHSQPGNWSQEDREMLRRAQRMLRDYGPILVKAGKLSK